ncbi:MAG TPA: hypothetical protein VNL38_02140 [Candidatus Nitrosotenuis sp.]|nr:hypothetical protein [Candidatus Nitrosotenuis sp.]
MMRFLVANGGLLQGVLDSLSCWGIEGELPNGVLLVRADRFEVAEALRAIGGEEVPPPWTSAARAPQKLVAAHAEAKKGPRLAGQPMPASVGEMLEDLFGRKVW